MKRGRKKAGGWAEGHVEWVPSWPSMRTTRISAGTPSMSSKRVGGWAEGCLDPPKSGWVGEQESRHPVGVEQARGLVGGEFRGMRPGLAKYERERKRERHSERDKSYEGERDRERVGGGSRGMGAELAQHADDAHFDRHSLAVEHGTAVPIDPARKREV